MSASEVGIQLADIESRLQTLDRELAGTGVRLASVFGSVTKHAQGRDLDLAVWFRQYSFESYLQVLDLANRTLGTNRVDVVVLNQASASLKLRALLEGRLLAIGGS